MRNTVKEFSFNHNRRSQSGFTLVEIAIVMLIVGIFMGSFLHLYSIYRQQQKKDVTETSQILINFAMDDFKQKFGRYPCPARYDAKRTDADYGRETDCKDLSILPGYCGNGYCIEESRRTVTDNLGVTGKPRVRRGTIPFRSLYLSEDQMYDAYGGRFSYAVTELLTDWQTFNVDDGGIHILDDDVPTSGSALEKPDSALYFVFSHGPDHIGAYDRSGSLMIPCYSDMYDNENCNTSEIDFEAIYRSSKKSDEAIMTVNATAPTKGGPPKIVNVNTHYDDTESFKAGEEMPHWKYSEMSGHTQDVHAILGPGDKVIFGTVPSMVEVNIGGNALATGNTMSQKICDASNGSCFQPDVIGGAGIQCATSGDIAYGIGGSAVTCSPPSLNVDCTTGNQFLMGFDAYGQPICGKIVLPVSCPSKTVTMCATSKTLPASPDKTVITLTAGTTGTYTEDWKCNAGTWGKQGSSGACTCSPTSNTTYPACGTGFTGVKTVTTTKTCPSGVTNTVVNTSACVCKPYTQTQTKPCVGPWVGAPQVRTQNWTCVANVPTPGGWSGYVPPVPACVCPPKPDIVTPVACPPPLTGTAISTQTWNTSTCAWNAATIDTSGCTCSATIKTQTIACTPPLTGTIDQESTYDCATSTWGPWVDKVNNCSCVNKWAYRPGPACPHGYTGAITEKQQQDCHGTALGPWVVDTNTCAPPPTYSWVAKTAIGGAPLAGKRHPQDGASCATPGPGTCYRFASGLSYPYNCSCE